MCPPSGVVRGWFGLAVISEWSIIGYMRIYAYTLARPCLVENPKRGNPNY
jgi:hypothetical protein